MGSRTTSRDLARRPLVLRTSVGAVAVLASIGLGAGSAAAAPVPTTDLSAGSQYWGLHAKENLGVATVATAATPGGAGTLEPVEIAWSGALTVTLPGQLMPGATPRAKLFVGDADIPNTGAPTAVYDSESAVLATDLGFTALGGNQYRIDMPADDGTHGPYGALSLEGFDIAAAGVQRGELTYYRLELSAAFPAAVSVAPQLVTYGYAPCGDHPETCPTTVTAGQSFAVTLPAGSGLDAIQHDLVGSVAELIAVGTSTPIPLTATLSADGRTATYQVPAGTAPGRYGYTIWFGTSAISEVSAVVDVVAPAVNPGLRSETGGDDSSPLLPIALGSVAALAVAGVAVRTRRAAARS
jgi:hypothetical protein